MPSPFPGMDPYLESPDVWPGFHNRLANEITRSLNRDLPGPYYADLEIREEIGIIPNRRHAIIPDVTVRDFGETIRDSSADPGATSPITVASRPRRVVSLGTEVVIEHEPYKVATVLVRDSAANHQTVTVIELLSPSHKRSGLDRRKYLAKRRRTLAGDGSLIEIDLLRRGRRGLEDGGQIVCLDVQGDYVVLVSRAWQRGECYRLEVFPISVREMLPVLPVPLRREEPEIPLDLQDCFDNAYDDGPYRRGRLNYFLPPEPPLDPADQDWAAGRIAAATFAP